MSRGFVKETDQEEIPLIPERPPLPAGQANYVTPYGLRLLRAELEELEAEMETIRRTLSNETEQRIALTVLQGKMRLLQERINSAQVLSPVDMPRDEIRFGAHFQLRARQDQDARVFQIVGVDEADVRSGKISFTAPLAKAVIGKQVGEKVQLSLNGATQKWTVESIEYAPD